MKYPPEVFLNDFWENLAISPLMTKFPGWKGFCHSPNDFVFFHFDVLDSVLRAGISWNLANKKWDPYQPKKSPKLKKNKKSAKFLIKLTFFFFRVSLARYNFSITGRPVGDFPHLARCLGGRSASKTFRCWLFLAGVTNGMKTWSKRLGLFLISSDFQLGFFFFCWGGFLLCFFLSFGLFFWWGRKHLEKKYWPILRSAWVCLVLIPPTVTELPVAPRRLAKA